MPDRYVNKTRPSLSAECKVSDEAEPLMRVCERVILAYGGERIEVGGRPGYRVRLQPPRLISGLSPAQLPVIPAAPADGSLNVVYLSSSPTWADRVDLGPRRATAGERATYQFLVRLDAQAQTGCGRRASLNTARSSRNPSPAVVPE